MNGEVDSLVNLVLLFFLVASIIADISLITEKALQDFIVI